LSSYKYVAKDLQGKVYKGTIEASSEREARKILKSKKLYVVSIKEASSFLKTLHIKRLSLYLNLLVLPLNLQLFFALELF